MVDVTKVGHDITVSYIRAFGMPANLHTSKEDGGTTAEAPCCVKFSASKIL